MGKMRWISGLIASSDSCNFPHLGITTWSGNDRMIGLAKAVGMQEEARVRQVRYYQDRYWDSVKYGILREEWQAGRQQK